MTIGDFRVDYLEEARECIRANHKIMTQFPKDWQECPEFWANLLGAVANSNVAAASDDVVLGLVARQEQRAREHAKIKKMLDERLGSR